MNTVVSLNCPIFLQPFVDLEFKVKSMQREINLLRDTLEDKDR